MAKIHSSMPGRIFSGLLWTAWGKSARTGLQLAALVVLARLVTPRDFGVIGAAMIVVGFSEILTKIGFGPALVQRAEIEQRHIGTAFSVSMLLSLLAGAAIWFGAPLIAQFFNSQGLEPVLRSLAVIFPIRGLALVPESLAQRRLDFKILANTETFSFFVGYFAIGVPMAFLGFGVWSLVGASLTAEAVKTTILLWYYPPSGFLPGLVAFRELAYFGGGYTLARIANHLALQGDYIVVGRALGMTALGIYGRAYQLMSVPAIAFGQVLDEVLFPSMAKMQHDRDRLAAVYFRGVSLVALVMLPLSVVGIIMAPEIVLVVLGSQWIGVTAPLQILLAGLLMRTSYKMSDSLARASGQVYRRAWRQFVYAGLVIGGAYAGRTWGVEGSAAGVLVAVTANFFLMAQMSLRIIDENWLSFGKAHLNAILLAFAAGVIAYPAALMLRGLEIPSYFFLAAMILILGPCLLLAIKLFPDALLGKNGVWMLEYSWNYAANKFDGRKAASADSPAG